MQEAIRNLWDQTCNEVVVITTNGIVKPDRRAVMGAGCAREARDRFPGIDLKLGYYLEQHGNRPFNLGIWDGIRIVSFPTKHNWRDPSDPALIWESAYQLAMMADKFHWASVVMPRPGCGNGQLSWPDVKAIIAPILDDRFTVVSFTE